MYQALKKKYKKKVAMKEIIQSVEIETDGFPVRFENYTVE